jgi:pilus assembly protein CpaC
MKKIQILLICSGLILSFWAGLAYASDDLAEEIILYVGQIKIFSVNMPTRIVIGKPEFADVTAATEKEITVTAKSRGTTTFVVWDNFGEQHFNIRVFSEDMREAKNRIDSLIKELNLPKVYTKAVDSENKILLLGEVKNAQERNSIFTALGPLKNKVVDLTKTKEEEAVIDIDVQVLELNRDATNALGFSWPGSVTLTDVGSPRSNATKLKDIFQISKFTRSALNLTLDALVQEGKARLLSRPRLVCQSGKEAELLVGGEKPILTTQSVSGGGTGTQVEYKEFGIKLKIKPTVNEEKRIKLGLKIEVSEVGDAVILGSAAEPTALAYPLSKRNVNTELALNDGQTLAIGGLRKQKTGEDIRKTPIMGDIPILGLFFRQKRTKIGGGSGARGDSELFITLTPTIVAGKEEPVSEKKVVKPEAAAAASVVKKEEKPADPLQNYISIIKKRITDNLSYPSLAKEAGFQGTVKLNLHLSWRGEPLDVVIKESSGYKILDENALSTAKGVVSYPPFPPSMDQKELWIEIPIAYRLD